MDVLSGLGLILPFQVWTPAFLTYLRSRGRTASERLHFLDIEKKSHQIKKILSVAILKLHHVIFKMSWGKQKRNTERVCYMKYLNYKASKAGG